MAVLAVLPLVLALTDFYLSAAPAALVLSTGAGALAVSALALQPFLAARAGARRGAPGRRRLRWHRVLGGVVLGLVLVHVGALFLVEGLDDTLFAMSRDGPTRARMALIALIALIATVILGATYRRLPIRAGTWRILHLYFAVIFIAEFVPNWHIEAICEHLEAITRGEIGRLMINIPPRDMRSLAVTVFWPCWEWLSRPETRWLFSELPPGALDTRPAQVSAANLPAGLRRPPGPGLRADADRTHRLRRSWGPARRDARRGAVGADPRRPRRRRLSAP